MILNEWPNSVTSTGTTDPNGNQYHCTTRAAFISLFSKDLMRLLNTMKSKFDEEGFEKLMELNRALTVCCNFLLNDQVF